MHMHMHIHIHMEIDIHYLNRIFNITELILYYIPMCNVVEYTLLHHYLHTPYTLQLLPSLTHVL